jgi:hypothetical protein
MSSKGANQLAASASPARAQAGIDPTSIAQDLISSVAKSAGSKIGGALAGWALDAIFGPSPQKDDETKLLLNDLQTQVKGVRDDVHQLGIDLGQAIDRLMTQEQRNTYDGVAAQVNIDSATLKAYQINFEALLRTAPGLRNSILARPTSCLPCVTLWA